MATRIIRIKIKPDLLPSLERAANADGYLHEISYADGIAYLEDTRSDVFSHVQDLCMDNHLPHDLSYYSDGETVPRQWLCYRPDSPSGITIHPVSEPIPSNIRPLAEC